MLQVYFCPKAEVAMLVCKEHRFELEQSGVLHQPKHM